MHAQLFLHLCAEEHLYIFQTECLTGADSLICGKLVNNMAIISLWEEPICTSCNIITLRVYKCFGFNQPTRIQGGGVSQALTILPGHRGAGCRPGLRPSLLWAIRACFLLFLAPSQTKWVREVIKKNYLQILFPFSN